VKHSKPLEIRISEIVTGRSINPIAIAGVVFLPFVAACQSSLIPLVMQKTFFIAQILLESESWQILLISYGGRHKREEDYSKEKPKNNLPHNYNFRLVLNEQVD
jgi:hypothetical protein